MKRKVLVFPALTVIMTMVLFLVFKTPASNAKPISNCWLQSRKFNMYRGLIKENRQTGRITRMSVAKEYRGKGFAKTMPAKSEDKAKQAGYSKLVVETNLDWVDAIHLYRGSGYIEDFRDKTSIHMYKRL